MFIHRCAIPRQYVPPKQDTMINVMVAMFVTTQYRSRNDEDHNKTRVAPQGRFYLNTTPS